jgi:serine/threonine protein kinase
MFECLVGYTPFYAEDPVTTCRKILRWRQCLEMPEETKAQLSPECIDFLSCLLAGPENRIGSSKNGSEFENGFKQVVQHPWYRGFDWDGLRSRDGPLLPTGSREFPELLEYLKYVYFFVSNHTLLKSGFINDTLFFHLNFQDVSKVRSTLQNVSQASDSKFRYI